MPALAYDVSAILGIGTSPKTPSPKPKRDTLVLRIPDGMSLQTLSVSDAGKRFMADHLRRWWDQYSWKTVAPSGGVYRVRLPVPDSHSKTSIEQETLLQNGESFAPVAIVVAALLCSKVMGGPYLLRDEAVRCAELTTFHRHVVVSDHGLVVVNGEVAFESRYHGTWLAASQKV